MHYIVVDLEWNQPLSHTSSAYRKVGDRLMFEMIQIGAVKLDESRRMLGSFNRLITPEHYMKLHPRIRRITGITQEDLSDAPRFLEAYERFVSWCGDDYVLITWGGDDISVFQQNIDFFRPREKLATFYDLQRLYCALEEHNQERRGLKAAMELYGVRESEEHPFHSAVDDAYYTARVFQRFPNAKDVLQFPQEAKKLGQAKQQNRASQADLAIRSERSYFQSPMAKMIPCPTCGKKGKVQEGYLQQSGLWTALADCPDHGLMFADLKFVTDEEGRLQARREVRLSQEQSPAYVATKHLQWASKIARQNPEEART